MGGVQRREYVAAIATLLLSGCTQMTDGNMTQEEAEDVFTDVTEIGNTPLEVADAARFTDAEAGVVFWGFEYSPGVVPDGNDIEIKALSIEETDL